jgi:hypothetical protein
VYNFENSHGHSSNWTLTPLSHVFTRRVFISLPPRQEALLLITKAFSGFNSAFPIFDLSSTSKLLDYPEEGHKDPSWWACLNIVLALAHRFEAMRTFNNQKEDKRAWGYLQNALAVVPELTMLNPSLPSVQALTGMAIAVQGTPNPHPYSSLLSDGIKLAQRMNLHRRYLGHDLSFDEIEQRKKVFWVLHFLDKDNSLRTGQPPNQDDDEMDVEMPSETISFGDELDFFQVRIKLALIQGKIYKRLCSVKALQQSISSRMTAVRELDNMLQAWRVSVPLDFQADYFVPTPGRSANPLNPTTPVIHGVILRLSYFNALNTVHQYTVPVKKWAEELGQPVDVEEWEKHTPPPPVTCLAEARKAIQLMHVTPQGDYACIW